MLVDFVHSLAREPMAWSRSARACAAPLAPPAPAPLSWPDRPRRRRRDARGLPRGAREVIGDARAARPGWLHAPSDVAQMTTVRPPSTRSRAARAWSAGRSSAKPAGPASRSTTRSWLRTRGRAGADRLHGTGRWANSPPVEDIAAASAPAQRLSSRGGSAPAAVKAALPARVAALAPVAAPVSVAPALPRSVRAEPVHVRRAAAPSGGAVRLRRSGSRTPAAGAGEPSIRRHPARCRWPSCRPPR